MGISRPPDELNGKLLSALSIPVPGPAEELGDKAVYGATLGQGDHPYGDFRARREASVWQRLNWILLVLLIIAIWLCIVMLFVPRDKNFIHGRDVNANL